MKQGLWILFCITYIVKSFGEWKRAIIIVSKTCLKVHIGTATWKMVYLSFKTPNSCYYMKETEVEWKELYMPSSWFVALSDSCRCGCGCCDLDLFQSLHLTETFLFMLSVSLCSHSSCSVVSQLSVSHRDTFLISPALFYIQVQVVVVFCGCNKHASSF